VRIELTMDVLQTSTLTLGPRQLVY
jgi:hypothetical protein